MRRRDPLAPINLLVLIEFGRFDSGDVKGTIRSDMRLLFVSNDVRRHRLISISYISLLPCHGTAKRYGRDECRTTRSLQRCIKAKAKADLLNDKGERC
jgi:hypothetical protein